MHRFLPMTRLRLAGVVGFAIALFLGDNCRGQESSGDSTSVARYVPKENVLVYVEFDGLDAHADAWKKTAAYKILNNTPTGVMLETVVSQISEKYADLLPMGKATPRGQDLVNLVEHIAKSGFVFAMVGSKEKPSKPSGIVVLRNAFKDKTIRGIMARTLQELNAPNTKPQKVARAGHQIVSEVNPKLGEFAWWVEESKKEDLVHFFPTAEAADVFLETLDGKHPNALAHPKRVELAKAEGSFAPTGFAFLDPGTLGIDRNDPRFKNFEKDYGYLGIWNINSVDIRWGFQDQALMTVTRISAPSPRTGLFGILLDGASFDKGKLPPINEAATGFTVTTLDLKGTYDRLVAMAKVLKPDAEDQLNKAVDTFKGKSKLRLKEDVLGHVGPRVAWYVVPAKAGAAAPASNGLVGMMMASAGLDQVPKFALVFDIDDPKAFGKVLDEVMSMVNRELKAQASKALGVAEPAKGARNRGPSVPSLEFRLTGSDPKMYVLNVPSEMSAQIPSSIRPSIRVGAKQAVLAITPDVARMVLEAKGNSWTPSGDLASGLQGLPSKLKMLQVVDPRETLPAILASLPGKIQSSVNTAMLLKSGAATPAPNAPPNQEFNKFGGGGQRPMGAGPAGGGNPGNQGVPGAPGAPGAPGTGTTPGAAGTFVLQVDASKLPTADSIKGLLFPSLFSIEVTDSEIKIVSREAFPEIPDPSKMVAGASIGTTIKSGGLSSLFAPPAGGNKAAGGIPGKPGMGGVPGAGGGNNPNRPD